MLALSVGAVLMSGGLFSPVTYRAALVTRSVSMVIERSPDDDLPDLGLLKYVCFMR